jgi:hypothetical protein
MLRQGTALAVSGFLAAFGSVPAHADGIPNFAPTTATGWIPAGDVFLPPQSGPGPVMSDPLHPRISNAVAAATGKEPTFHMGDAQSPLLRPWAQAAIAKRNGEILAGKPGYIVSVACWPLGVPSFLLGFQQPLFFAQAPNEVLVTWQQDHEVRHIYMDVPHSAKPKPSWHGESVGHYENGDTLVVDTIGISNRTYIDHFRTPHTAQLHVVERFRLVDAGKTIEVSLHVEDPGTFTESWNAVQRYRRNDRAGPMVEFVCAENNNGFFGQDVDPMPIADHADF